MAIEMMKKVATLFFASLVFYLTSCNAWSNEGPKGSINRRSVMASAAAFLIAMPGQSHADTGAEVRGIGLTPFNGLAFQYRGTDFGGLKADDIAEPSVSYEEFVKSLQNGEVSFVEFLAPAGDVAYVTFAAKDGGSQPAPIRIGEGYPIEQADGWSSPAFVVRTVKNAGVPYKFTVPALQAYKK